MKSQTLNLLALAGLVSACLLPEERQAEMERQAFGKPLIQPNLRRRQFGDTEYPIGSGNRFSNGSVPRGIGIDNNKNFQSILNIKEVASGVQALASAYPSLKTWTAPGKTLDGNSMTGLTLGDSPRVFIEGGIHARERGGPDYVLYFLADLLAAEKAGTGISYGSKSYTAAQVKTAIGAGIVLLPLVNPDGVDHDQKTSTCWRKNRNTASSGGNEDAVGVDLNRNFDFLWDYKKKFNQGADLSGAASDDPTSDVFHGKAAFSEIENQNIEWVMDQHNTLSWFLDLHSYAGDILYAWGDDDPQSTDKTMNFNNTAYDGKRGYTGTDPSNSKYKEYISAADLSAEKTIATTMAGSMNSAGSNRYSALLSSHLYPTSGGSNDYAIGRYYGGKCGASKLYGLTIEFGSPSSNSCPFYPTSASEYTNSMKQVGAGLMELVLNAAAGSAAVTVQC